MIVHVCSASAWEEARASGTYRAESSASEGFIHFSGWSQLPGTVARYYADVEGLVVLVVDPAGLDVRVENGFPRLYEPLPVSAVTEVLPLEQALARAPSGTRFPRRNGDATRPVDRRPTQRRCRSPVKPTGAAARLLPRAL